MNKTSTFFFSLLSIFITSCFTPVQAEIVETMEISDIFECVSDGTLVLVNISDTLYAPSITLTNHLWRIYFAKRVQDSLGKANPEAAEKLINSVKHTIVTQFPKKLVEPNTPDVITSLSGKGIPVLGITKKKMSAPYADNFGEITHQHLVELGINLETALVNPCLADTKLSAAAYSYGWGILFTNGQPEGPTLKAFLDDYRPRTNKIVMIDNSLIALERVADACKDREIAFTGMRYGRCDDLAQSFDPDIGTIQFFAYINGNPVPSDEEAKEIKDKATDTVYAQLLDDYIAL